MALRPLNFEGLQLLDGGKFAAAFEHEMAQAVRDCLDRPGDKGKRTVTIEIELVPLVDHLNEATHVDTHFKVQARLPKRKTRCYELLTQRSGRLLFNEHAPDAADQTTIFDADAEGRARLNPPHPEESDG